MYLWRRRLPCCAPYPASFHKGARMTFARQSHDATDQSRHLGGEENSAHEGRRFSPELCEAILHALGSDDRLRREYLRRRWHGLIGWAERSRPLAGATAAPETFRGYAPT